MSERKVFEKKNLKRARTAHTINSGRKNLNKLKVLVRSTNKNFGLQLYCIKTKQILMGIDSNGTVFKLQKNNKTDAKSYNTNGALLISDIFCEKLLSSAWKDFELVFDRGGHPVKGKIKEVLKNIQQKGIKI